MTQCKNNRFQKSWNIIKLVGVSLLRGTKRFPLITTTWGYLLRYHQSFLVKTNPTKIQN